MSSSSSSSLSFGTRTHNKSGQVLMSIATVEEGEFQKWIGVFDGYSLVQRPGLCGLGSPCLFIPAADGRLTYNREKVCYAYQLVARRKFGYDAVKHLAAAKAGDDMVISHSCGSRNCVEKDHLLLESKLINDERTHDHFVMGTVFNASAQMSGGVAGLAALSLLPFCRHTPKCGSVVP